jgi:NAD(P)-dependent dehydrogenase (short-subunit alcohol dehydrogenase family)
MASPSKALPVTAGMRVSKPGNNCARPRTVVIAADLVAFNRKAMPKAEFAKWPKPEGIARVILFLCSADAKVIHGASIPVYGNQ